MKVVSADEMRRIDERAQNEFGFDAFDLMAAAGRAIAETIVEIYRPQSVCVICGKGNNAGDGFVAALVLHELGLTVNVICLESPDVYHGAARTAWDQLGEIQNNVKSRNDLNSALESCDVVIDALLGTGIKGPARAEYAAVIRQINSCGKPVVAADVPSGLREIQTDEEPGEIVRAAATLTIGLPKTMLLLLPGANFAGRVIVLTISFPEELLSSDEVKLNWAPQTELRSWLPARPPDSNKGTYGSVGIIGGTTEYAGATVLVAKSALRSGCGLVAVYTLPQTNSIYKIALPEATSIILESDAGDHLDNCSATGFEKLRKPHTVLAMGPGLGTAPDTADFVQSVLNLWKGPLVLDADALNILSEGRLHLLKGRQDCIITPHPGEMERLTGKTVKDIQENRLRVVHDFSAKYEVTVLLKGSGTIVGRPDGQVWLIPGSEPALAKGGTGDVLTGCIAALFAQGMPMWQAGVVGASAHLAAGRRCAKEFGRRGVLAGDVANAIPLALDDVAQASLLPIK